jgi:hypothetical protein
MKNPRILKIWRKLLQQLFKDRFGTVLNEQEITLKVNYVIDHFDSMTAEQLYKNCVFCNLKTPFARFALDYGIRFIENFEETFKNPSSIEIDESLSPMLNREMVIFNDYVESLINCDNPSYEKSVVKISNFYNVPMFEHSETCIWMSDYDNDYEKRYYCDIGQLTYASVFGILPQDGRKISDNLRQNVKKIYPQRVLYMEKFAKKYPSGTRYLSLI